MYQYDYEYATALEENHVNSELYLSALHHHHLSQMCEDSKAELIQTLSVSVLEAVIGCKLQLSVQME